MSKKVEVIDKMSRQGDILITRVDSFPEKKTVVKAEGGVQVLAHSETGHHHVVAESNVDFYQDDLDILVAYLEVKEDVELRHLRSFDTHGTQLFKPGKYKITKQRQKTRDGWMRAAD